MREIKKGMDPIKKANPNMVEDRRQGRRSSPSSRQLVADPLPRFAMTAKQKTRVASS